MAKATDENDATIDDLQLGVLTQKKGAIFHEVDAKVLTTLLPGAKVKTFKEGEILFTQGDDSKKQFFYVLIDAVFSVTHIVSGYPKKIAEDRPGVIAADVEIMVRGIPAAIYGRQKEENDCYLSTVVCVKEGKVLLIPEKNVRESNDFQLAWNIGTALAIKIVQRNMPTETQLTVDHDRIVGFLCQSLSRLPEADVKHENGRRSIRKLGRRVDVVEDTDVTYYDIREFVYRYDLTWEGRYVTMPDRVFDKLTNDPVNLPLAGKNRLEMHEWRKSLRKKEEAEEKD